MSWDDDIACYNIWCQMAFILYLAQISFKIVYEKQDTAPYRIWSHCGIHWALSKVMEYSVITVYYNGIQATI